MDDDQIRDINLEGSIRPNRLIRREEILQIIRENDKVTALEQEHMKETRAKFNKDMDEEEKATRRVAFRNRFSNVSKLGKNTKLCCIIPQFFSS